MPLQDHASLARCLAAAVKELRRQAEPETTYVGANLQGGRMIRIDGDVDLVALIEAITNVIDVS